MSEKHYIRPRDIVKLVLILGLLILAAVCAAWALNRAQDIEPPPEPALELPTAPAAETEPEPGPFAGYVPKEQINSYLFMGIDREGPAKSSAAYRDGGQADVQVLMVVDDQAQTWQLLQINRDSMVEVPVLGITGRPIRTEVQQITLAHAYGDGGADSCRNAAAAVSNMLGGQKIDGYLSLNMGGISILNDFVGGVTVTIESDFSDIDPSLVMGQTVTLTGEQAYNFIRSRKDVDDQTNLARMQRHRQYMAGLGEKLMGMSQNDVIRGYDAVFDYMVTDIGSKTMTQLLEKLQTYTQLDTLTVDGESYLDEEGYNAYALNEESLNQVILELFYQQK